MRNVLLILILTLAVAACESTPHYNRTKLVVVGSIAAKRSYGSVKLFQTKEEVGQPFETIALLSVEGSAGEEAQFMKAFLYRAADVGADAVIFQRVALNDVLVGGALYQNQTGVGMVPYRLRHRGVYRGEAIRLR